MGESEGRQLSLAELMPHPAWAFTTPPRPRVQPPPLTERVQAQLQHFESALVTQGIVCPRSALAYRLALTSAARHAQRHLDRPLEDLELVFDEEVIAAVALDDRPFSSRTHRLSLYTKQQERVALRAYLRAVGLTGRTFEEGCAILDRGFRRAARREGYSYSIPAGRPRLRDGYRPPLEDVRRFFQACPAVGTGFAGPRLAAAAALSLWHDHRTFSVLSTDGSDFQLRRGTLYLVVKEKAADGRCREIQVRAQAVPYFEKYVESFNSYAASMGWRDRIGFGIPGPFFRDQDGSRWKDDKIRRDYHLCCRIAGVPSFTPHALRRLHACGLAAALTIDEAAAAGGWRNVHVFLKHYARPLASWQPQLPLDEPAISLDDDRPAPSSSVSSEVEVRHDC